ncbi:hypothetical protein OGAPHI_004374 [Ogataea philodendri]|uniref:Uncharacterized protein n=1 Tax=Ogataea philodendri TaxID=1378263 RepID=A0A9P8T5K6_9ASCO|nr:uncharacterized protein OGAPHI_004374 [Ogataea philodendri]KAH3666185.1 hypothetical protein OGAPHI_004374 [Ogataea philodendri]
MVADLSQLHDLVVQTSQTGLGSSLSTNTNKESVVVQHLLVKRRLQSRKLALDDLLNLVWKIFLHIFLQSSQQERSQNLVQSSNNQQTLFFRKLELVLVASVGERSVEPLIERLNRVEHFWKNKVQQRPKLRQVVLQWSTCQNQSVSGVVVLLQSERQFRGGILHTVTLIDDHVRPFELAQQRPVSNDVFVSCEQHREVSASHLIL